MDIQNSYMNRAKRICRTNHFKYLVPLLTFVVLGLSQFSCSKSHITVQAPSDSTDQQFLVKAFQSNNDEMEEGGLATAKSVSEGVRSFAQRMVTDFGVAQNELKLMADSLNLNLPAGSDSADLVTIKHLDSLSGSVFDSTFVQDQINDHLQAAAFSKTEINSGKNKSLVAYANKYLQTLQTHLLIADSLIRVLRVP